jgi:hypothetical protein
MTPRFPGNRSYIHCGADSQAIRRYVSCHRLLAASHLRRVDAWDPNIDSIIEELGLGSVGSLLNVRLASRGSRALMQDY